MNDASGIVGFSLSVIHSDTWPMAPTCYLGDLYVSSNHGGGGIGTELIQDLIRMGKKSGWASVYRCTAIDNSAARSLYDKFVATNGFIRCRLFLSE